MGSPFNNFWKKPEGPTAEEETAGEVAQHEKVPTHRIFFRGRSLLITVVISSFEMNTDKLNGFGAMELGETVKELLKEKAFRDHLAKQSIVTNREALLVPCVELPLGSLSLYAAASSQNHATALRMAVDRLALSLMNSRSENKTCADTMSNHHVTVAVNA